MRGRIKIHLHHEEIGNVPVDGKARKKDRNNGQIQVKVN